MTAFFSIQGPTKKTPTQTWGRNVGSNENYKLFHYSAYFYYYSWPVTLFGTIHGPTVLFQLIFIFIYSTFSNKFLVLAK